MSEYIGYEKESPFPIIDGSHPKYAVLTDEEIVRCRDCKHIHAAARNVSTKRENRFFTVCVELHRKVDGDDFCAWGEKR